MTRQFLNTLERELSLLAPSERNEIINEYRNHIEEALKNGESEADILKELGDPEAVAKEIISLETDGASASEPVYVSSNLPADFNPKKINTIDIKGESLKVTVVQSETFDMVFHSPYENGGFEHSVQNDVLNIRHHDIKDSNGFGSFVNLIKKTAERSKDELTIYWPESLENLLINTNMGAVLVDGISAGHFNIKTDMGSTTGKNLIGVRGVFNTNMGSAEVYDSTFDSLDIESRMGKVTLKGADANAYNLHTDMGKIDAFDLSPDSNIKAKTDMGAIRAHFKSLPVKTKVITKTDLGKVQNELEQSASGSEEYTAEFITNMGAVKIRSN